MESNFILKTTKQTVNQMQLEVGFSSFSEKFSDELQEFKQNLKKLGWFGGIILVAGLAKFMQAFAKMIEGDALFGWLALIMFSIIGIICFIIAITGDPFFQSWTFDYSTDKLTQIDKSLHGTRKEYYRLSRFGNIIILEPKQNFDQVYCLALVKREQSLFGKQKFLKLVNIGSQETADLQEQLSIYRKLCQEIAEFMNWSTT